jgi:hypothetical protein
MGLDSQGNYTAPPKFEEIGLLLNDRPFNLESFYPSLVQLN